MPVGSKNQTIAGLGCHHIAIQTKDWDASETFYTEVMGMKKVVEDKRTQPMPCRPLQLDINRGIFNDNRQMFASVATLPAVLLFIFFQRYFIAGMMVSGIKG